jgi:hypothetical protein
MLDSLVKGDLRLLPDIRVVGSEQSDEPWYCLSGDDDLGVLGSSGSNV